ncbi:DUF2798 domain-containing protein [Pontibacter oryzae]|uniref:DUF2798 domain-containing protein n=1 Tax=Pontibacter oryzae TaxID=2304593 RepID=A0A399S0F4_9BACT|nr:DUF2798 domain-containing protein [Pontibacter oryzae]RIJ36731.1 DUF2798 domain-containing protein [Pontibacter oryzae]
MKQIVLRPQLRRKLLIIAVISLLLASALEMYTFGLHSDFPGRWLRSFLVFYVLIAITSLLIVPGVNYGMGKFIRR